MKYGKWSLGIVSATAVLLLIYLLSVPNLSLWKASNPKKTAFMEYRERQWKEKNKKVTIRYIWVPLSRISPFLVKAVLIAEDDKFWSHEGFDYEAIRKAIERDLETGKFKFGGSTISQQLARNLYLSPTKSLLRKLREAIITWRMESVLSKRRILELYLNVVEWGEGIFGAEAASRHYYGKPASELTPREASRLASVLPNPKRLDPTGDQRYVTNRSEMIYSIMVRRGVVPPEYEVTEEPGPPVQDSSSSSRPLRKPVPSY